MKRMRYIHAVALTVLVALTAACTSDERELANTDFNEPINIAVGSGEITASAVTRGHTSTTAHDGGYTFASTDKVKVGLKRGTAAEELKTYTISSTTTGALTTTNQFNWSGSGDAVTIRAYSYGYSSDPDDPEVDAPNIGRLEFTVEASQNDYTDDLELLYAPAATFDYATYHSTGVTLNLYHQLSRVVINVKRDKTDDAYDEIGSSTVPNVKIGDGTQTFPHKAYLEVPVLPATQGTWYNPVDDDDQIEPKYWSTPTTGYEHTFSAVLIPGDYSNKKLIYIKTASGEYYYTPTSLTLLPGKQYTFNIGVRNQKIDVTTTISNWETVNSTPTYNIAPDIKRNPLWYVAQYNMAQDKRSFVAAHSTASQYVFTYDDAQQANIAGYHVPSRDEQLSIIPSDNASANGTNIFGLSTTYTLAAPYEFSEIACNVGNNPITASTSVFGRYADKDFDAVRFINTPYASAWHYKWLTSPCNGLLIESYLLYDVTTLDKAKDVLQNLASSTIFTGSLGSASANQTPEETTEKEKGFVQRFLPVCGAKSSSSGQAASHQGVNGYYWSSTSDTKGYYWLTGTYNNSWLQSNAVVPADGYSVRLFKDNYTTTGTKAVNTMDNILAGISDDYAVGDVVCKDGSIFRYNSTDGTAAAQAKAEGRMPVGIIAYKGNGEADTRYNHALVIAMEDWNNSGACQWFTANSGSCVAQNSTLSYIITNYKGIEYTNTLADATCNAAHDHAAAKNAKNYDVPLPPSCSQWFLPTIGQWSLIVQGLTGDSTGLTTSSNNSYKAANVNTTITTAGGSGLASTHYWSSVEYNTDDPWVIDINAGNANHPGKSGGFRVRPIFAF